METKSRGSFTSNLGFILATAGSAIGLGNLCRFPPYAAKNGGGLFILVYIILAVTFGFALMATEIAIGRKTGVGPLQAYGAVNKKFKFLGFLATLIPGIIFPYYCVIGGWVCKYMGTYITGGATALYETGAKDYFFGFLGEIPAPLIWFFIYIALNALVVLLGIEKGIEKASKILLPILLILIIGIAVYSLTLSYTDANGEKRTALQGLAIYLIPNFEGLTFSKFARILLDACSQMFYSLSIAMGILIAYGSYAGKKDNLISSVNQIEIFDTGVALLAGLIVVPSVFVFQGAEGLEKAGLSLMFISLPMVFEQMGFIGHIVGSLFFLLVFFAAMTSSISLMEAITTSIIDRFKMSRKKATVVTLLFSLIIGIVVCLGYNVFYMEVNLPNGATGQQILDILDYLSNSLLLPILALLTCLMVWVCKPKFVLDELAIGMEGKKFRRRGLYIVMMKYIVPILLLIILLAQFNVFAFLG